MYILVFAKLQLFFNFIQVSFDIGFPFIITFKGHDHVICLLDVVFCLFKITLLIQKFSAFSLEFQKFFSITRTMFSHSRSEQFWEQNTISASITLNKKPSGENLIKCKGFVNTILKCCAITGNRSTN